MRDAEGVKHVPFNSDERYNKFVRDTIMASKQCGLAQYIAVVNGVMTMEEAKALMAEDKEYVIEEKVKSQFGIEDEGR